MSFIRIAAMLLLMFAAGTPGGVAQEINIGAHLNPILCIPVPTAQGTRDRELRMSPAKPGYSYGLGASITTGRLSVEAGASLVEKHYSVRQSDFKTATQTGITAKSSFGSAHLEVPVVLRYTLSEHIGQVHYSTLLLAGVSYEWMNPEVISDARRRDSAASGDYRVSVRSTPLPDAANLAWANLIAGAQIRAVMRGVGLIEYGLALHLPLQATGPYEVETVVMDNGGRNRRFHGEFYPRLAYLDFRIRYCFLNYKRGEGRVRYRG